MVALAFAATLIAPAVTLAAQPTVNLGDAKSFAVLAGETITNTGDTRIGGSAGGNVGLFAGTSLPGQADITLTNGAFYLDDEAGVASRAKDALTAAYLDAAGRTPVTSLPTELGGRTLTPGVYAPDANSNGQFQITGTLTLKGDGVFIFLTDADLITASGSSVVLDGAQPCKIFWKIGSSATLGTDSVFVGHILANNSIAAQNGATIKGSLLAQVGSVTLDHNTITNDLCRLVPANGGELPKTATPLYDVLLLGVALMLVGAAGWSIRKRFE
jgi:LPXTG-motif cell wall-anchored protein